MTVDSREKIYVFSVSKLTLYQSSVVMYLPSPKVVVYAGTWATFKEKFRKIKGMHPEKIIELSSFKIRNYFIFQEMKTF